jgi:D-aminopeptidase
LGYTESNQNNDNATNDATTNTVFDENAANADGGVVVTRSGGLDPAVWQALRALFCTDTEWQAAGQAVGSFATSSTVSQATETAVRKAAQTALQWELDRKPTTLQEDETLQQRFDAHKSKAVDRSTAEQLALTFRIEKKKVLQECLRSL